MSSAEPALALAPAARETRAGGTAELDYVPELDGLRAAAVTLVVLLHAVVPPRDGFAAYVALHTLANGWIGVDLFFALSGFLITRILLRTQSRPDYFRRFYTRRLLRIFPLYYAVLAVCIVLARRYPFAGPVGTTWPYFTYTTNFWPLLNRFGLTDRTYPFDPLGGTWSLAVEEQFYLLFPAVVLLLERERLRIALWIVVAVSPFARLAANLVQPGFSYFATFSRLDVLAMGALVALRLEQPRPRIDGRRLRFFLVAGTAAVLLMWVTRQLDFRRPFFNLVGVTIVDGVAALVVLALVARQVPPLGRTLRSPGLVAVGRISYGIYLLHAPVVAALRYVLLRGGEVRSWGQTFTLAVSAIAVTLALAAVSWVAFERPLLSLKDTRWAPEPTRAA